MKEMNKTAENSKGVGHALLAAVLLWASSPLAKAVFLHVATMVMAGRLYLGSGLGLGTNA
jgi:hypothetical protein